MTRNDRARYVDKGMTALLYVIAAFFIALLIAIVLYLFIKGFAPKNLGYIFNTAGIGNQLFNTVYLVILSLLISVPCGVVAGMYLALYAKKGRFALCLRVSIETLSSLPSIVVGLFGYLVFIVMTGAHWNLLAGACSVSILMVPLLATTTEDALKSLPEGYMKASYGMGATKYQTIRHVLLPACIPALLTGILLAAGRAFGEAAALLYTAGMSTDINWSSTNILSPTNAFNPIRPGETLSLQIWALRTEALADNATDLANVAGATLLVLVGSLSLGARYIGRKLSKRMMGG